MHSNYYYNNEPGQLCHSQEENCHEWFAISISNSLGKMSLRNEMRFIRSLK